MYMEPYLVFELSLKVLAFEKYAKMGKKTFRNWKNQIQTYIQKPPIFFQISNWDGGSFKKKELHNTS